MRTSIPGFIAVLMLSTSVIAADDEPAAITSDPSALSDEELDRRIGWLKDRLDDGAGHAKVWQYGWTGSYALGIGIGAAKAIAADDDDARVDGIVTATKGVIGTARILYAPHPARLGADPIRAVAGHDRASNLERLAIGESQLLRVAECADKRLHWKRHVGNVLLNLIGGAIILGFGDATDAAISAGVGVAVGELNIFTSPARAAVDLSDYRQRFAGAPRSRWQVSLAPSANGVMIRVDF